MPGPLIAGDELHQLAITPQQKMCRDAQIAQAENWINNYPRKILGYKSSEIVFRECLRELGIAA